MEDFKTISAIVIELLQTLKWPVFLLILLWQRKLLFQFVDPFLELLKRMKELKFTINGKKVSLVPKDVEDRIEYIENKAKELYPEELEYIPVPYLDSAELENVLGRLQALEELFDFKLEDITDTTVIKLIGAYYYLSRDFEASKKYYLHAEELVQDDIGLYTMLGSVFRRLGKYDKALDYYKKATDIDNDFAWAHYGKAITLKNIPDAEEEYEKNFNIAFEKFEKELGAKSYKYLPYFGLACINYHSGAFPQAEENLTKSIKVRENFAPAYFNRAIIRIKLEQKEERIMPDLIKAVNLNPMMRTWAIEDQDFEPIRNTKCYQCFIGEEMKA